MIDLLAFAPHPDDVEFHCAGTLVRLQRAGRTIGIVDLTRGEMSTRGDPATRARETDAASRILKLDFRRNLAIPDGAIADSPENRLKLVTLLREIRPRTVFLPYHTDRHPDHEQASRLVRSSLFVAGLRKVGTGVKSDEPHRPTRAFYYMLSRSFTPDFIVDVTDTFDTRLEAMHAYQSQVDASFGDTGHQTVLSSDDFLPFITARARHLGFQIGTRYGEGFGTLDPLEMPMEGLIRP